MKIKRCALAAAVVMAVCAVVLLCRNNPSDGMAKSVSGERPAAIDPSSSAVVSVASASVQPSSNQTATVRGTKPYVLTCEGHFNKALRRAAEALGVKTVEVLSRNSLLVEADSATIARVRASGKFSVEREFLPSDKIAPQLAAQIAGGAEAVEVAVVTLSADDHRRVQDRVVARGGEILTGCFNEGTTFRARMSASLVSELASFGDVRWMEQFVRPQIMNDRAIEPAAMNVSNAWVNLSLSGAGQFVSTSDSGIDLTHPDLMYQVVDHKVVTDCVEYDGIGHGTHTAGSIAGDGTCSTNQIRGSAWGAKLYAWFCGKEGDRGIYTPKTKAELFRGVKEGEAEAWDVYIHSASWGSAKSGEYDTECADLDKYVWEHPDFLPVFSAGNEGSSARTIGSPAAAKNVLTVGATQNLRKEGGGKLDNGDPTETAEYSSRGPCKDGRTKPDIAAPGTGVLSTRAYNQDYSYGVYAANTNYAYDTGTSMACPLTAGAVALVREWLMKPEQGFTEEEPPTAALMKAIVTGGAKDAAQPNNDQGWGRIDVMETLVPSNRAVKLIDRIPFADGEDFTWVVETTNDAPLDVQLAWIDFPGAASTSQSAPKLVNDLDLTVQSFEEGTIHYGNGGDSADTLNTLESVRIDRAAATRYYVTVSCPTVFADHTEGGAAALYIRGAFDPETIEPYYTVRIVRSPTETNTYSRLEKALREAVDGDVIEILDRVDLRESVTLTNDFALTLVATNANPRLSPIVRRNHADILVTKGSLFFTNTVFQTESTTPVKVSNDGVVKVAGTAVFDDIVSRTPGVLTDRPEGFVLAGRLENGITVDCTGKSQPGDRFGTYSCDFAVAAESAPRLISSYSVDHAGVAEASGILKWADGEPVAPEVAVAYVNGDTPVFYRTLDQLFKEHPNGTNVVITKSGLRLEKPRTLSGRQSISAEDGVGEIVVNPEGSAGFTVGAGCDLTVAGITFEGYTGNGLFVVNGADAELTVKNSAFRDIEGTNKWSGAIAILKGHVLSVNTVFENCRATGDHLGKKAQTVITVRGDNACGGAIYLAGTGCTLDLDGGRITGCLARKYGGGVYVAAAAAVSVSGDLTVKDNMTDNYKGTDDDIHLVNASTSLLTLTGRLKGIDTVGVRYEQSAAVPGFGNNAGNCLAVVKAGVSSDDALASTTAFFNDTEPETTRAEVDGDRLFWIKRTPGDRQVEPGHPNATVRVTKGGETRWYIEPDYAFEWIEANDLATVEILTNAVFSGDLVVTNGATVTLVSTNVMPYTLTRLGETEIRVLPGASLAVTNAVLDGNGTASTIGFIKVEGEKASLELQFGATVTDVIGSADRASGAISVQNGGAFTMRSGAAIVNCENRYANKRFKTLDFIGYGGGLLVEGRSSTANLLGGQITGCTASRGGGVFIGTESTVNVAGDMIVSGNRNLDKPAKADNLCVADRSGLHLIGQHTGKIGYSEGRSGDTDVFGKVTFSGSESDIQSSAHNFTHDITLDIGMAVTDGTETLLVWSDALDENGKYGDGTYALVNGGEPRHEIAVPVASNFTYDGTEKICLTDGVGYRVLAGNVATNVGNYVVLVTTRAGFAWNDETPAQTEIPWKIEVASYVLKGVTFEDATFTYDGTMKYLALTGTLPDGFSVEYLNNGRWQPGTNEVKAVISGSVPNYEPDPFTTTLQAKLIIIDPEGKYHGETEPPGPLPTVTTNWPSAIAFESITRVADTNWILTVTNRVKWCRYRLICTDDLVRGFTTTGDWEQATAAGPWTTNVIFSADEVKPAYFWRAEGTWGIVPEGEE